MEVKSGQLTSLTCPNLRTEGGLLKKTYRCSATGTNLDKQFVENKCKYWRSLDTYSTKYEVKYVECSTFRTYGVRNSK